MNHPLVFLIGLHGTGKSTVGRRLATEYGFHHLSLGDLGRLLRRRKIPSGYSLRFLRKLAAHEPGQRMARDFVESLHAEITVLAQHRPIVVDGFPAEPYHVAELPCSCTVVYLSCPEDIRLQRLAERGESTPRRWTPGGVSSRDQQVGLVVEAAMQRTDVCVHQISTLSEPSAIASQIAGYALRTVRKPVSQAQ